MPPKQSVGTARSDKNGGVVKLAAGRRLTKKIKPWIGVNSRSRQAFLDFFFLPNVMLPWLPIGSIYFIPQRYFPDHMN